MFWAGSVGFGLTVTVTVNGVPEQVLGFIPKEGVTLYTTSIGAFVVLFNVCPIVEVGVVWLLAPEIPVGLVTVQV